MRKIFAYQFNIERYRRDTNDLTMVQNGAYRIMLDEFYLTGGFLPNDFKKLFIICKAMSKSERDAIKFIVGKYFTDRGDGYLIQKRAVQVLDSISKVSELNSINSKAKWNKNKDLSELESKRPHMRSVCQPETINHKQKKERELTLSLGDEIPKIKFSQVEFDEFWNIYPRKASKSDAIKSFTKVRQGGITHETIITGAKRYAFECRGKEQRYIAHASTWLNAGRWDDEPGANCDRQNSHAATNRSIAKGIVEVAAELIRDLPENQRYG